MIGRDSQILKNPKKNLSELTRIIDDTKNAIFLASAERNFCVFFVSSLMWENCLRELTPSMFRRNKKKEKKNLKQFSILSVQSKKVSFIIKIKIEKIIFASEPRVQKNKTPIFNFFIKNFGIAFSVFLVQSKSRKSLNKISLIKNVSQSDVKSRN